MKDNSVEIPSKLKFKKSVFLLEAIAHIHHKAGRKTPPWATNARAQFVDGFAALQKKSKFYRMGYAQAMWDMWAIEFSGRSESRATDQKEVKHNSKSRPEELPYTLRNTTNIDKRDYYEGKVDSDAVFLGGGLSARQKCMFFMATNHENFVGLTQKDVHGIFLELKLIANNQDESQTRQWLGEIGFRSDRRGRPTKPKT